MTDEQLKYLLKVSLGEEYSYIANSKKVFKLIKNDFCKVERRIKMKNVENMMSVQREIINDMVKVAKKIKENHNGYSLQFSIYNAVDDETDMIERFFKYGELVNQLSEKIIQVCTDNYMDIDEEEIIWFDEDCLVWYQNIYDNMPYDKEGKIHCTGRYVCQIDEYDEKAYGCFRPEWEDDYWIKDCYEEET